MNCPVCGERLRPIQRSGIEVDICPGCKGVWLDRGELDKLITMEAGDAPAGPSSMVRDRDDAGLRRPQESTSEREGRRERHHDDDDDDDHGDRHGRGGYGSASKQPGARRRGSWLGDILGGIGGDD